MTSWKGVGLSAAAIGLRVPMKLSPSRLLAGLAVVLALNVSALAAEKDYATCIGKDIEPDKRIAACTPIAKDTTEVTRIRVVAYFYRGIAWDDRQDQDRAIADYSEAIALDPKQASP